MFPHEYTRHLYSTMLYLQAVGSSEILVPIYHRK